MNIWLHKLRSLEAAGCLNADRKFMYSLYGEILNYNMTERRVQWKTFFINYNIQFLSSIWNMEFIILFLPYD